MEVSFQQAVKLGLRWLEQGCEIPYIDPEYGVVLRLNSSVLSLRLKDRKAWFEWKQ